MSWGLLEEQIIFSTKPKRDYWAQYRNAQRTFLCAQGKFSNFLDNAGQQILWKSWFDIEDTWKKRGRVEERGKLYFKTLKVKLLSIKLRKLCKYLIIGQESQGSLHLYHLYSTDVRAIITFWILIYMPITVFLYILTLNSLWNWK